MSLQDQSQHRESQKGRWTTERARKDRVFDFDELEDEDVNVVDTSPRDYEKVCAGTYSGLPQTLKCLF